jgi:hypothetical protein
VGSGLLREFTFLNIPVFHLKISDSGRKEVGTRKKPTRTSQRAQNLFEEARSVKAANNRRFITKPTNDEKYFVED